MKGEKCPQRIAWFSYSASNGQGVSSLSCSQKMSSFCLLLTNFHVPSIHHPEQTHLGSFAGAVHSTWSGQGHNQAGAVTLLPSPSTDDCQEIGTDHFRHHQLIEDDEAVGKGPGNFRNLPQSPFIIPSPFNNPSQDLERLSLRRELDEVRQRLDMVSSPYWGCLLL